VAKEREGKKVPPAGSPAARLCSELAVRVHTALLLPAHAAAAGGRRAAEAVTWPQPG